MGTYFNYAIDWQHGYGCQIAGFLTVFATELSIYTLTVISVERWYAITYAINLNKRLKMRRAANIMSIGWIFALTMAFLPLVNVNGYSRTSICLPMKNQQTEDVVYLMILLFTNSMAFLFIFFCYGNMYMTVIRHQSKATANDMAVAKRMAMLVITDFLCWAPVAFFATTAVAGYPLIDVTNSKILLVFFYPLNSCANPFLYAIFTTQYRRDFLILLKRCDCCNEWTRKKKDRRSSCNVPPLQFSSGTRYWNQNNSQSSQMSTDNSMKVLRPSDLSSQQDVFSTSGWEDQEVDDAIHLWKTVCHFRESISSDDSGQCCKNYSSSSHSTTHRGSPHPVKNRFVHLDIPAVISPDDGEFHTTKM
ncbi:Lutropin-choriogonadotropic hormone receptor, partial [Stegodyphus mimosarum]